jgi:type II secretory pathway pseudopilin PulG
MEVDIGAVAMILVGIIIAGIVGASSTLVQGANQRKQLELEAELAKKNAEKKQEQERREQDRQRMHDVYKRFMLAAQLYNSEIQFRAQSKADGFGMSPRNITAEEDLYDSYHDVLFVASFPAQTAAQKVWGACVMNDPHSAAERLAEFFAEAQADLQHRQHHEAVDTRTEPAPLENHLAFDPASVEFSE